MQDLTESRDLEFEYHHVTTEDGYILELHRIYQNDENQDSNSTTKPVFFMQHGVFASSESYVLANDRSSAFVFANLGYDVWLGNSRGSMYSKNHTTLDPTGPEFLNFSFWELGKYDNPAMIDYVLNETGHDQLTYMGHSEGTSSMFTSLTYNFGDL